MMFETKVDCPAPDRYVQHQHLDRLFRQRSETQTRDYVWRSLGGPKVLVRRAEPVGDHEWQQIPTPRRNTEWKYILECVIRRNIHPYNEDDEDEDRGMDDERNRRMVGKRDRRVSDNSSPERIPWFINQAQKAGFAPRSFEMIDAVCAIYSGRPYTLGVTVFMGVAQVTNPVLLERAMLAGIGNTKCYGFGYLYLYQDKDRRST